MKTKETISAVLRKAMLALVVMLVICSVYSLVSFRMIGKNLTTFYQVEYSTTKDQMEIRKDVQTIIKRLLWAVVKNDPDVTAEQAKDLEDRFTKIDSYVRKIASNLSDASVEQQMNSALTNFKNSGNEMLELVKAGQVKAAVSYYEEQFLPISETLADVLGDVGDMSDAAAEQKYNRSMQIEHHAMLIQIVMCVAAVAAALYLSENLAKRIVQPIESCAKRLHLLVTEGDLHTEVPKMEVRDEASGMLADLDRTIAYLREIVSVMSEHLEEIAEGNLRNAVNFAYTGDFASLNRSLSTIYDSLN